jgi:membrane protease YdiL (CAAX protease family)
MKEFLRNLSARAEFLIVVVGAFGLLVLASIVVLIDPSAMPPIPPVMNEDLWQSVYYEVFALALLGGFLGARKWTFERLGISVDGRDTVIGIGLMALVYAITWLVELVASGISPGLVEKASMALRAGEPLGFIPVTVKALVSATFEEVFVCAYVITVLRERRGVAMAMNVSVGLRIAYHLYQGALGVLTIAPVGLLFSYWYVRSSRIWPVIVAHALLEMLELMMLDGALA